MNVRELSNKVDFWEEVTRFLAKSQDRKIYVTSAISNKKRKKQIMKKS